MRKVSLIDILASGVGKLFTGSDFWLVERYGKRHSGHKNTPRDYHDKPVTEEERKTTERFRIPCRAYQAMDKHSAEYQALMAEFEAQRHLPNGIHTNVYCYYMHREMERLRTEGDLASDPTKYLQDWSLKKRN